MISGCGTCAAYTKKEREERGVSWDNISSCFGLSCSASASASAASDNSLGAWSCDHTRRHFPPWRCCLPDLFLSSWASCRSCLCSHFAVLFNLCYFIFDFPLYRNPFILTKFHQFRFLCSSTRYACHLTNSPRCLYRIIAKFSLFFTNSPRFCDFQIFTRIDWCFSTKKYSQHVTILFV